MRATLLVALLLSACAQQPKGAPPSEICQTATRPFVESWPCMRPYVASSRLPQDIAQTYIATGDYVAEEVRAGRMTESGAKLAMARARQAANDAVSARTNADADPVAEYLILRRFIR